MPSNHNPYRNDIPIPEYEAYNRGFAAFENGERPNPPFDSDDSEAYELGWKTAEWAKRMKERDLKSEIVSVLNQDRGKIFVSLLKRYKHVRIG